jgi:hypothetical protein
VFVVAHRAFLDWKTLADNLDSVSFPEYDMQQLQSVLPECVNGKVELALRGLENVLAAKRDLLVTKPIVEWRYLLFNCSDNDE